MKKYTFTDETITVNGVILHRIKALTDFFDVSKDELGGFIEKEENLSHDGVSWIHDNAKIFGNARVYGNTRVCDNAIVYDNAEVYGDARVYGNAKIFGNAKVFKYARVYGDARIYGNTRVYDSAIVCGNTEIYDNAKVYDIARVYGNAKVFGNANVFGNATVFGKAKIYKNAIICKQAEVTGNAACISNICNDIEESIRVQTGLIPINGEVIAYKQVKKDLSSFYDNNFIYKIGEYVEVDDADMSDSSCSAGLHFSNATYWNSNGADVSESIFLIAKIKIEDIITVQEGKIRCKRAFIMGKYDIKE